jgi:hypothetical protein
MSLSCLLLVMGFIFLFFIVGYGFTLLILSKQNFLIKTHNSPHLLSINHEQVFLKFSTILIILIIYLFYFYNKYT